MKQPVSFTDSYTQLKDVLKQSELLSDQERGQEQAIQALAGAASYDTN